MVYWQMLQFFLTSNKLYLFFINFFALLVFFLTLPCWMFYSTNSFMSTWVHCMSERSTYRFTVSPITFSCDCMNLPSFVLHEWMDSNCSPDCVKNTFHLILVYVGTNLEFSDLSVFQQQSVELIPITKVTYKWNENHYIYFVYGIELKVKAVDYPATCCCTII